MVYKRLFLEDEGYEVGCKHPRQHEETAQQSSVLGITHCNDIPQKFFWDEGVNSAWKSQHDRKLTRGVVPEDVNEAKKELELNSSSSISSDVWVNDNVIGESSESEALLHFGFFPHYFELNHHRANGLVRPHDSYTFLLDHDHRIPVSVGPDHQADVPEWVPQSFSQSLGSCKVDGEKFEGACVVPMTCMLSPTYDSCMDGGTRNYCNCLYKGSISCVKQHVAEARDKLRENIGQKIFEELGFSDMGEEVAKKWMDDEEQTFQEVVLSNPASQGKKFWDNLSAIFPSKTKHDLVNYYFNVFMLRKRGEQNRFDPSNIDSDNDEWKINELGITREDDDSVVEYILDGVEEGGTDTCKDDDADSGNHLFGVGKEDEGDVDDFFDENGGNSPDPDPPSFQFSGNLSRNNKEGQDIEDNSCTSYEGICVSDKK